MSNFLMQLATDGYKLGHGQMYRKGTTTVGSNLTPRTDKIHRRNCTAFYEIGRASCRERVCMFV